jgi:DNA-binding beta-propeller fold protein YncE/cytochrome b involved in lipid metabolism
MELFSYIGLHTVYLFIFSIALGLGLGATILANALFFFSDDDGVISSDELRLLRRSRYVIWFAILLYGYGGVGLFTLAYESMLALGIFYASMVIVSILFVAEVTFHFRHIPRLSDAKNGQNSIDAFLLVSSIFSATSWIFLTLHHAVYRASVGFFLFLSLYFSVCAIGLIGVFFLRRKSLDAVDGKRLKSVIAVILVLSAFLGIAWFKTTKNPEQVFVPTPVSSHSISGVSYTADDVALHANTEDCWLSIDGKVFNATPASELHPALFTCGGDSSENYHKNHGVGIRDKMMKFYIGELSDKEGVTKLDVPFEKSATLTPLRELYVKEGSWDPRTLMVIVEKDAEKLLMIDGTTHEEIGRINDVGFQPHTSVFSNDAKFMYIISRDGWLTKIDLTTLQPVKSVSVGENSRGTALTDNNKYIAIGNYSPGNVVILDTLTLSVLKTIPLVGKIDGKEIESRAGAILEDGNRIIVALKDLNSVWAIDTDKEDFPVTNKFTDIGNNVPMLHDAFLTPNGKHYIVASQGSKTAWVLDLQTMKPIAEVKTGDTPHTGPGAAWGNFIYVPSMGEGLITVIDVTTWEPVKFIKTGGPGLFVRSYSKNPKYPYVWADTAFGHHRDEIYVIDARINEIVKTIIPVPGESSWHPEFTFDGKFVYVVSMTANEVEVYDANTFALVKRIKSNTPSAISNVGLRIEEPGL